MKMQEQLLSDTISFSDPQPGLMYVYESAPINAFITLRAFSDEAATVAIEKYLKDRRRSGSKTVSTLDVSMALGLDLGQVQRVFEKLEVEKKIIEE